MLINKAHSTLSVLSDEHALSDDQLNSIVGGLTEPNGLPTLDMPDGLPILRDLNPPVKPIQPPIKGNTKDFTPGDLGGFSL